MEEMQLTTELTWIEVQFLKKALDEVLRCRMTLKWTYAMAYYLEKDNAKELFEDNQRCAHLFTYSSYVQAVLILCTIKGS
jgi:ariadne-1